MSDPYSSPAYNKGSPDDELRARARRRVQDRRGFQGHLVTYVLIILMLWVIWLLTDRSMPPWPLFPMVGWGVFVALHGFNVYGRQRSLEQEVEREVQRMRARGEG